MGYSGTKATKKPVEIEFFTFEEVVNIGIVNNPESLHDGIPWVIAINGHNLTHENNECYIIPTLEGSYNFTPNDVLIIGVKGEIYPCKKDIFNLTYNVKQETTFLQRLIIEEEELNTKLIGLGKFLDKPNEELNSMVGNYQKVLLQIQLCSMDTYHKVLQERIKDLSSNKAS